METEKTMKYYVVLVTYKTPRLHFKDYAPYYNSLTEFEYSRYFTFVTIEEAAKFAKENSGIVLESVNYVVPEIKHEEGKK